MAIADITLLSGFEANTEHLDGVSNPPSHQIITIALLCDGMSIMAPIALLIIPGRRDPQSVFLFQIYSFLWPSGGLESGGGGHIYKYMACKAL